MLKYRVITAVILAALLLSFLFIGTGATIGFFTVAVTLAAWEWAGMSALPTGARIAYAAVVGALLLAAWLGWPALLADAGRIQPLLGAACTGWAIALLWIMGYPASAGLWGYRGARAAMGLVVLVPAWAALAWLRFQPGGQWLILFMFALVASADIGAYFTGRRFGRHKLAAAVSPGKTVEGLAGGVAATALLALVVGYSISVPGMAPGEWIGLGVVTALASVIGDLLESMVKRERGIKDSGSILPGHGGLMDRLDSISAAAPVFALGLILLRANGV